MLGSECPVVPLGLMHHRDRLARRLAMPGLVQGASKHLKRLHIQHRSAALAGRAHRLVAHSLNPHVFRSLGHGVRLSVVASMSPGCTRLDPRRAY